MFNSVLIIAAVGFSNAPQTSNENLYLGTPSPAIAGKTQLLLRRGFVVMHDNLRKEPLWVAYRLRRKYLVSGPRKGTFAPDPDVPEGQRSELSDYRGSGFDRGHMAPAADMKRSEETQRESFYLSNIVPQDPRLNQGLWANLESSFREHAKTFGDVLIFVGPVFSRAVDDVPPPTIGDNQVWVPSSLFRIVVRKTKKGWAALAYEMPNSTPPKGKGLDSYLTSIDHIEKKTGLNFLNALPVPVQARLEAKVAKTLN